MDDCECGFVFPKETDKNRKEDVAPEVIQFYYDVKKNMDLLGDLDFLHKMESNIRKGNANVRAVYESLRIIDITYDLKINMRELEQILYHIKFPEKKILVSNKNLLEKGLKMKSDMLHLINKQSKHLARFIMFKEYE